MKHPRYLSAIEQGKILALRKHGMSMTKIGKAIERPKSTVSRFLNNPSSYQQSNFKGSKKKTSERDRRQILRLATSDNLSCAEIKKNLKLDVSRATVNRVIQDSGCFSYEKRMHTPELKPHHIENRLAFAKKHLKEHTIWPKVIFSDEKRFNLDGPDGLQYYWHDLRFAKKETYSTRSKGGGGLMVWGCFSAKGKSDLAFLEGKVNTEKYISTLNNFLLPFAHFTYGAGSTAFKFQQDNAPIHVSKEAREYFKENDIDIDLLEWPSKSPDLNPIENLWGYMVLHVYQKGNRQFRTKAELKNALIETWNSIPNDLLVSLSASMPDRCIAIIESRGEKIGY